MIESHLQPFIEDGDDVYYWLWARYERFRDSENDKLVTNTLATSGLMTLCKLIPRSITNSFNNQLSHQIFKSIDE